MKIKVLLTVSMLLILKNLNAVNAEDMPQPYEYFNEDCYANIFCEKSLFVEIPSATGAVIGDTVGIIAGYPLGALVGVPASQITSDLDTINVCMHGAWMWIGIPTRTILSAGLGAPFYMLKKIFWDLPRYCYDPAAYED